MTIDRIRVGELHIDIFDVHTKKFIWHASAADGLPGNPEKNQKKLNKAVAELFKRSHHGRRINRRRFTGPRLPKTLIAQRKRIGQSQAKR